MSDLAGVRPSDEATDLQKRGSRTFPVTLRSVFGFWKKNIGTIASPTQNPGSPIATLRPGWVADHSNLQLLLLYEPAPEISWCGLQQQKKLEILVILSYHCLWQEFALIWDPVRFLTFEILMYGGRVLPRVHPRGPLLLPFRKVGPGDLP